jgi:hypothetical protein
MFRTSARPNPIGVDGHGRRVFLLELESLRDFPSALDIDSPRYVLMLAGNSRTLLGSRRHLARRALESGCVYACVWGPGCEAMHDTFDHVAVADGFDPVPDDGESVIMTTWHDNEPVEDAAFFALWSASPVGTFSANCNATVLAVAGPANIARLRRHVRSWFPCSLTRRWSGRER